MNKKVSSGVLAIMLVAHPSLPVKNVKELIALAKARPGELNLANVDPSSMMAGHLFCMLANVKIEAVPYKGAAPMMIDLSRLTL